MPAKPAPTDNLLALPDGTELVGDYRIKRVLGAGGFGITYLADEKALARLVTIKEYFPADFAARKGGSAAPRSQEVAGDYQWGLDRFIEEAQTLARFDHPNIVRVHRYFRANNTAYMVLHFEEGGSFKSWLKGLKRAPRQAELDSMIAPLLDALEIIHKANFLHRDIAPDNIMVRKDGSPVLIDFGSARGQIASHSRTVSALVKPGYSPYEQYATTTSSQGPWTDIYALGATLYHAIAGKRPPDAPSRVVSDEYVPARRGGARAPIAAGFLGAIDTGACAWRSASGRNPSPNGAARCWRPSPSAPPGRLGLRAADRAHARPPDRPSCRRRAVAPAEPTVAPDAVLPQDLVPVPPDAPQPKGQLLDFIDALKRRRPPILAPQEEAGRQSRPRRRAQPARRAAAQGSRERRAGRQRLRRRPPPPSAPRARQGRAPRVLRERDRPSGARAAEAAPRVAHALAALARGRVQGGGRRHHRQPCRRLPGEHRRARRPAAPAWSPARAPISRAADAARRAQGTGAGGGQQRPGPLDRIGGCRRHARACGTRARARWCAPSSSTRARRPRSPSATAARLPGTRAAPSCCGTWSGPRRSPSSSSAARPSSSLAFTADPNTFAVAAQDGTVALFGYARALRPPRCCSTAATVPD